jgi:hypothetical protein
MSSRYLSFGTFVTALLLGAKCGGDESSKGAAVSSGDLAAEAKSEPKVDPCALLTIAEIAAVTGAKSVAPKAEAHGSVAVCNYQAGDELLPVVSILLSSGMPKVSTSKEMAAWRSKQGKSWGDIKIIIEPVEGLGVPAIRNEVEGTGMVTVEAAVHGMLLDITTSSLEHSKALAEKAMKRLP